MPRLIDMPDELSRRVLIFAPFGRDGALSKAILGEGHIEAEIFPNLAALLGALESGAGAILVTQEAILNADLRSFSEWIEKQESWSDLPIVIITSGGQGPERNPIATRLMDVLGNVILMERPFHPYTLVSTVRAALRSRARQYQARDQLAQLERQRTDLAEGEDRFRTLAENIPVLTWMANPDGWIFWYNSRWYDYTGTTPEQMEGWGWQRVHDAEILPAVLEKWQAAIATGKSFEMVFPLRGADHIFRPFLTKVEPVRDTAGRIQRWFGTNVDLSTEREAEAAVRSSEERLRFALAAGKLGAWELLVETGAFICSALCSEHFGRVPDHQLSYEDVIASVHPDDTARMRNAMSGSIKSGEDCAVECRISGPEGTQRWVEIRGRAARHKGMTTKITGVSMDITARKNAESELSIHRMELERIVGERTEELASTLENLRNQVKEREKTEDALRQSQKMEAVGQLTGGIAHDFNNLLTGISGSLELMKARVAQGRLSELDRYMVAATQSVTRAAALTHRLLAFARRQTLERKIVDINALSKGMEDLIRRTVGPSIVIELVLGGNVWATSCDVNQLENALLNLCINATDAMPDGGRLTIETANAHLDEGYVATQRDVEPGQYVALSVSDTGTGMSKETAANAFDPFFTTKPIGQGTGLGLSMVYGFVKQSDGHVRIYTQQGQGTTIRLYLPRHMSVGFEADDAGRRAGPLVPVPAGKTVLIVEDEAVIRDLIVDTLEDLGFRAIVATDGLMGLRLIKTRESIDLLLTDVGLPGMNGRQLADAARIERPGLKILFMTGYAYNASVGSNFLEPDMHIVTKPFALETLAAKVLDLIES